MHARRLLLPPLLLCLAAAPEPPGYWTGPIEGAVPQTIAGGTVIHTAALAQLLEIAHPVLVDVASAPHRPATMAPGTLWLPLPHQDIPGSVWIPDAGRSIPPAGVAAFYRDRLAELTRGNRHHAVVVYCHPHCWLSWNAARRAILAGYDHVYWYPDGVEGWHNAGFQTTVAQPERPPG